MDTTPSYLLTQIREGKVVLLLGSGASREADDGKGNSPPLGSDLATMLSEKFLGGKYNDYPLDQVGELSISESTLLAVQQYIREVFEPFQPTEAHELMTTFLWEGLVTTNWDL